MGIIGNAFGRVVLAGSRFLISISFFPLFPGAIYAQQSDRQKTLDALEKDGCVSLDAGKVKACKYDYVSQGKKVEALTFQPAGEGRFPGVMLIPGYQGSATSHFGFAQILAQRGFACLTVAQPGFGKSDGPPDYGGPKTVRAMIDGLKKFRREPYVDKKRMGVFGYSRGGMVASLMAVKLKELKAVVLGAGVYDFKRAYDDMKMEGIRENMRTETGMTADAIKERSSVLQMEKLQVPVLILHGEKDENVPVNQALLLRDRLTELKKDFEIKLFPTAAHGIPGNELISSLVDFFSRRLRGVKPDLDLPKFR